MPTTNHSPNDRPDRANPVVSKQYDSIETFARENIPVREPILDTERASEIGIATLDNKWGRLIRTVLTEMKQNDAVRQLCQSFARFPLGEGLPGGAPACLEFRV